MDIELSKEAKQLLKTLYAEYQNKRDDGYPKSQAMNFGSSEQIHKTLMSDWLFQDVDDTCYELGKAGLLSCKGADNIRGYFVQLNDNGVAYMDNKLKRTLKEAGDIISNFLP